MIVRRVIPIQVKTGVRLAGIYYFRMRHFMRASPIINECIFRGCETISALHEADSDANEDKNVLNISVRYYANIFFAQCRYVLFETHPSLVEWFIQESSSFIR